MKSARPPAAAPHRCPLTKVFPGRTGPTIGSPSYALALQPHLVERAQRAAHEWVDRVYFTTILARQPQPAQGPHAVVDGHLVAGSAL